MWDTGSLNWPILASVIYQIPWIPWIPVPFEWKLQYCRQHLQKLPNQKSDSLNEWMKLMQTVLYEWCGCRLYCMNDTDADCTVWMMWLQTVLYEWCGCRLHCMNDVGADCTVWMMWKQTVSQTVIDWFYVTHSCVKLLLVCVPVTITNNPVTMTIISLPWLPGSFPSLHDPSTQQQLDADHLNSITRLFSVLCVRGAWLAVRRSWGLAGRKQSKCQFLWFFFFEFCNSLWIFNYFMK